jgi:protein with PEP-CTERM/exosortase system signal
MPAARYMNRIWVPAFVGPAYVFSRPGQVANHAIQNYYSIIIDSQSDNYVLIPKKRTLLARFLLDSSLPTLITNHMNKIKYIVPVLIAIAGLGFQQAKADTFTFDLSVGNSAISGNPGPYAHAVVTTNGTNVATVTFTSLTNSGNIYLMGDGSSMALNVSAALSGAAITGSGNSGTGFTPGGPFTVTSNIAGGAQVDGLGRFNLTVDTFDGFSHSSDTLTISLTRLSGTWGLASTVLTANAQGFFAASHIFVTTSPANAANGASVTGFAGNGGGTPSVPDGGTTVMLLGAAFGALGMARRFLKI